MFASGFEFHFIPGDENKQALVGGGNIEGQFKSWEIWNGSPFVFAAVVFRDLFQRAGEITTEDLAGTTTAPGQAFFAVGGEDAEGGVFKSSVEVAADNFLGLFAFVGIDADADKVSAGLDDVFLGVLTVRRLGVAGSEDTGNTSAL